MWVHKSLTQPAPYWCFNCFSQDALKDCGRMCCVLLHVEKVWTVRLLCPTKPVWKKEAQQLSWCNVSFSCIRSDECSEVSVNLCCWCWLVLICLVFWPRRDLMDRLVDEAEGLVDSSVSVCSNSSGRIEASADQQLNILNSITASDLSGEYIPPLSRLTRRSMSRAHFHFASFYCQFKFSLHCR